MSSIGHTAGIALSLCTATFWAVSSMVMASVGRRIGSINTCLIRILLASAALLLIVLPLYAGVVYGFTDYRPAMPSGAQWMWMIISGAAGLVLGDLLFYEALVKLGPRRAVKMNTLCPVAALIIARIWLDEALGGWALAGAGLVIAAIAYAATARPAAPLDHGDSSPQAEPAATTEPGAVTASGLICGLLAAICIGVGSVTGRLAFNIDPARPLDPIIGTIIRVSSAGCLLWIAPLLTGSCKKILAHLRNRAILRRVALGTTCGPLLGMLCYVGALKLASAGLVSTLMSTSTLLVIPMVAIRYRVRIGWGVAIAAAVAVVGVGLISWNG